VNRLTGRAAIVSGAGRGIGRAIALKLAAEGAAVVVNDLDPEPAEATVADIKSAGGNAVTCLGDVTEPDFAHRFVQTAIDTFDGLDIIVNNAGYTWDTVIHKMADEQWDAILDVHLRAPFTILRTALPYFKAHPVGHHRKVVNISSISGLGGNAGQVNYSAAKAGVVGLTKTLAKEWGRYRVNVNAVAFGLIATRLTATSSDKDAYITINDRQIKVGINTQLFEAAKAGIPLGRPGTPEEAAGSVYLLCTPESDYISGQVLACGGGYAI